MTRPRLRPALAASAVAVLAACAPPASPTGSPPASPATTETEPEPTATRPPSRSPDTISPADVDRQLAGVDELEQTEPLTRRLPHDSAHFRVDYHLADDGLLVVEIELRAVLNRPDQLAAYEDQLRAYRAEALAWLASVGADPASLHLTYRPPEAATL